MWIVTGKAAGVPMMDVVNMDNIIDIYTADVTVLALPVQACGDPECYDLPTITLGRYRTHADAKAAVGVLFARMQDAEEHRRKGIKTYIQMPSVQGAEDMRMQLEKSKKEKEGEKS